jgi:hypothetical protein
VLLVDEQIPPAVLVQYPIERLAEHVTEMLIEGLKRPRMTRRAGTSPA